MKKGKFKTGNIVTISLGHMSHDIYTSFLAPMLPFLIEKFNLTYFIAGFLGVAIKAPSLLNPIIGLLADKISLRYFVILAPGISAITMSILGLAPFYSILLILLFVTGISSTLFHIPSPVMIKQICGEKTGTGMSFFMFGGEIARTLGPLIITGAISLWGLEGSFRVMPIGIITSVILYFKLKNITICNNFNSNQKKLSVGKTIKKYIPFFIFLGGYVLFRAGMKSGLVLYLAEYLDNKGESGWIQGISISMLQLGGVGGTILAGCISDKIGKSNTLLISSLISPLLLWWFVSCNREIMIPLLILMGFFLFAPGPVLLALVQDTNSNRPSFINSIYMTINFGLNSIVILLTGILGDKIGLDLTFKICAFFGALTIPLTFLIPYKMSR